MIADNRGGHFPPHHLFGAGESVGAVRDGLKNPSDTIQRATTNAAILSHTLNQSSHLGSDLHRYPSVGIMLYFVAVIGEIFSAFMQTRDDVWGSDKL